MGTVASVHVLDEAPTAGVHHAIDAVLAELARLEGLFSTFRPTSQISQVNRGERHLLDCAPEVVDVLDAITWLESVSGGAFRARCPDTDRLDPAGFVKGWATERASRHLDEAGLEHWYVSVGGDIQTRGSGPDGEPWRVALADPATPGGILGVLHVVDGAVATSGTAERGRHLWDGRTGADTPADGLRAVTVVGPHLTWCDAFATTVFALGTDGPDWVRRFAGYEVVAVA
ncbi:MAG: FAD:protein FMN transferase [Bacteroidetes bacterium]|nr:FAD:protein FMN transferase [Bacteroidota bacterium]